MAKLNNPEQDIKRASKDLATSPIMSSAQLGISQQTPIASDIPDFTKTISNLSGAIDQGEEMMLRKADTDRKIVETNFNRDLQIENSNEDLAIKMDTLHNEVRIKNTANERQLLKSEELNQIIEKNKNNGNAHKEIANYFEKNNQQLEGEVNFTEYEKSIYKNVDSDMEKAFKGEAFNADIKYEAAREFQGKYIGVNKLITAVSAGDITLTQGIQALDKLIPFTEEHSYLSAEQRITLRQTYNDMVQGSIRTKLKEGDTEGAEAVLNASKTQLDFVLTNYQELDREIQAAKNSTVKTLSTSNFLALSGVDTYNADNAVTADPSTLNNHFTQLEAAVITTYGNDEDKMTTARIAVANKKSEVFASYEAANAVKALSKSDSEALKSLVTAKLKGGDYNSSIEFNNILTINTPTGLTEKAKHDFWFNINQNLYKYSKDPDIMSKLSGAGINTSTVKDSRGNTKSIWEAAVSDDGTAKNNAAYTLKALNIAAIQKGITKEIPKESMESIISSLRQIKDGPEGQAKAAKATGNLYEVLTKAGMYRTFMAQLSKSGNTSEAKELFGYGVFGNTAFSYDYNRSINDKVSAMTAGKNWKGMQDVTKVTELVEANKDIQGMLKQSQDPAFAATFKAAVIDLIHYKELNGNDLDDTAKNNIISEIAKTSVTNSFHVVNSGKGNMVYIPKDLGFSDSEAKAMVSYGSKFNSAMENRSGYFYNSINNTSNTAIDKKDHTIGFEMKTTEKGIVFVPRSSNITNIGQPTSVNSGFTKTPLMVTFDFIKRKPPGVSNDSWMDTGIDLQLAINTVEGKRAVLINKKLAGKASKQEIEDIASLENAARKLTDPSYVDKLVSSPRERFKLEGMFEDTNVKNEGYEDAFIKSTEYYYGNLFGKDNGTKYSEAYKDLKRSGAEAIKKTISISPALLEEYHNNPDASNLYNILHRNYKNELNKPALTYDTLTIKNYFYAYEKFNSIVKNLDVESAKKINPSNVIIQKTEDRKDPLPLMQFDKQGNPVAFGKGGPEMKAGKTTSLPDAPLKLPGIFNDDVYKHKKMNNPNMVLSTQEQDAYFQKAAKIYGMDWRFFKAVAVAVQESGQQHYKTGNTVKTSVDGAVGIMQIMPATFRDYVSKYKLGNLNINNPEDNLLVGSLILAANYYSHGGDYRKSAMRYFGTGSDGNGKTTASYMKDVMLRLNKYRSGDY